MKIFIGSSTEATKRTTVTNLAYWVEEAGHDPVRWDRPDLFLPGHHIFSRLIEISKEVDAAVLVFSEDDKVWHRNDLVSQPRDNVLLEYGLFAGTLGPTKVIVAREGKAKNPSDLGGIVHLDLSPEKENLARVKLSHWMNSIASHGVAADQTRLQLLQRMKTLSVSDPTIDLFIAAMTGNADLARQGMEKGGDPNLPFGELINKHHGAIHQDDEYRELLAKLLIEEHKKP